MSVHVSAKGNREMVFHSAEKLFASSLPRTVFWIVTQSLRPKVYPYLVYCASVWASTYPTNLNRLVLLQKKIIRIISKMPFDAHTDPIFKSLQIMKLSSLLPNAFKEIQRNVFNDKSG